MMSAGGKPSFSFGFSKKAEPKRVVEALKQEKPKEDRVAITAVEEGKVTVDGAVEEAKKLSIPCKNPLLQMQSAKKSMTAEEKAAAEAKKRQLQTKTPDDLPGGLVTKNLSNLSEADAEAARELLKDASRAVEGLQVEQPAVKPILMQEGSKRAREGDAPDATISMFDKVSVESFGEALLRGMGYDPEKHSVKPVYHDRPRDNLLGLGAKALSPSEKLAAQKRKNAPGAATLPESGASASVSTPPTNGAGVQASSAPSTAAPSEAKAPAAEGEAVPEAVTGDSTAKKRKVEAWPSRGLVVRVISKQGQLKDFFGAEVVVLEVDETEGTCRVKGRPAAEPNGKSRQLQGVRIFDLETRVSKDTKQVRIVRGSRRGTVAKLLKRDTTRSIAVVNIEGAETEMPLDDVCQFMA